MGFLTDIFAATGERTDLENPALWLPQALGSRMTQSGESVTPATALTLPVLWSCGDRIGSPFGSFPVEVRQKRRGGRGSDARPEHPAQELLSGEANPEMLAHVVRRTLIEWALFWGNGYAEIERDNTGRPVALWPTHPSRSRLRRWPERTGPLVLEVHTENMEAVRIPYEDVLHIRGMGDGQTGYSVVQMLAETIGTGLASQMFAASFFGNGAHPGIVMSWPAGVRAPGDDAIKKIKSQWKEMYGGRQSFELAVAYDGAQITPITIPPRDAQFVESGKLTRADLYGALNVPAHMVGDNEHSTFANIENLGLQFSIYTLLPWVTHAEAEYARRLLTRDERRQGHYIKHNMNALQRGDYMSRTAGYRTLISTGVMTPNEARDLEDMNPLDDDGMDASWLQGAMKPVAQLAKEPEPVPPALAPFGAKPPMPEDDDAEKPEPPMPMPPEPMKEEDAMAETMRPVFLDVAQRMMRKEAMACERARKSTKTPQQYDEKCAIFWRTHAQQVREAFASALGVCGALALDLSPVIARLQQASMARRGASFDESIEASALAEAVIERAKSHGA